MPSKKPAATLTCGQLGAAVTAAEAAGLYRDGPTARALNALVDALTADAARDTEPARVAAGPLPVSTAQVDEILEELRELGLDKASMRVLRHARRLIAGAEKQAADEEAAASRQYVTRQELEAALEAMGAVVGCAAHQFGKTYYRQADLIAQLSAMSHHAPPKLRPFLTQMVNAVCSYREPKPVQESYSDRMAREAFGTSRPRN